MSPKPPSGEPVVLEPRPYTAFDPDSPESHEAMAHVKALLGFIGDDPAREGLVDTPKRVVKAMNEHYWGYRADPREPLKRTFSEVENYDELVLLQDMEIQSHCEHHMVPFVGKAHVAYIPNGHVVGLSKLARVVEIFSKRLQVQEKLTAQIANTIQEELKPQGVAVIIQARHFCMCYRGVRQSKAWTTTSKLHGVFLQDSAARMELFTLIGSNPGRD
ncbi:MAG: GTP cyclohydrolase I FolE [Phycisphaera sp.]|nr:GTP cyclohydrolase I FolE [Phycisphaera sp.]